MIIQGKLNIHDRGPDYILDDGTKLFPSECYRGAYNHDGNTYVPTEPQGAGDPWAVDVQVSKGFVEYSVDILVTYRRKINSRMTMEQAEKIHYFIKDLLADDGLEVELDFED